MAQRALPNPYADYDKSLATGYFDAAGRVSGAAVTGLGEGGERPGVAALSRPPARRVPPSAAPRPAVAAGRSPSGWGVPWGGSQGGLS